MTDRQEARSVATLFDVPAVKEALFLLLGGGLDEAGKEKWLAMSLEYGATEEHIFSDALSLIDGQAAT